MTDWVSETCTLTYLLPPSSIYTCEVTVHSFPLFLPLAIVLHCIHSVVTSWIQYCQQAKVEVTFKWYILLLTVEHCNDWEHWLVNIDRWTLTVISYMSRIMSKDTESSQNIVRQFETVWDSVSNWQIDGCPASKPTRHTPLFIEAIVTKSFTAAPTAMSTQLCICPSSSLICVR